ncbi:hypothetical protein TUM4644_32280 [Shewanella colwelliana]|uniref:Uncharacterized protein n=1 Tax=Shewanella colwelliana TaxID=23 RepID=A0A1E5IP25_SHECO|nr:hypothetical protein [Shewanella colwelliana]OEG72290.1 hypothetical protein BEL05_04730 [Shewanella colwelliana]OEG75715.1 hypothetical protein BEL05_15880 [Shewanella colwelliana]GIU32236.1 hypothetical protein TUM4644_32280 [Shewanella colwelliana]GIU43197.1 hypothetical protein TUM3794_28290 [Shewanella colwelliana]
MSQVQQIDSLRELYVGSLSLREKANFASRRPAEIVKMLVNSECMLVRDFLLAHYLADTRVPIKSLLQQKKRSLDLYRYILTAKLIPVEKEILLSYMNANIHQLDEVIVEVKH